MGDLHRLTHVEDKDLRPGGHRGGLHHQPAGFRNRHEEACDVGVRHRYRAALGDLLAEARDHRAVRPQHVAETRGDELRLALHLAGLDGQTERLYVDLRQTLRATHDVGRVDGLVRRDHDHLLDVVFDTLVRYVTRTGDVGQYGFAGVLLHQRHVLVGGRVEDHLRTVGAEGVVQTRDHAHVADYGDELQIGEAVLQFETDVVHRGFGVVEEDELLDAERGQLPAQLRTDRTGGTRHHDRLAAEVGDDFVHRDLDLFAPQQVLDLDLADGLPLYLAVDHLVDRGGDQHLQPAIRAEADQPFLLLAGLTGVGEEDGVDVLALLQVLDILLRLEVVDRQVGQHVVLQRLAVGQEADHLVLLRVLQLGDERCPLVTGSVDEDPAAVEALLTAVLEQVVEDDHHDTHDDQGRKGQQHIEHQRDADIRMPVFA